jgi:hypothetical protein
MLLPIPGKGNAKEKAKEPARPAARQRKAGRAWRACIFTKIKEVTVTFWQGRLLEPL